MDQGVDGFRMDAVHYMVEHIDIPDEPKIPNYVKRSGNSDLLEYDSLEHIYTLDQNETYDIIKMFKNTVVNHGRDYKSR